MKEGTGDGFRAALATPFCVRFAPRRHCIAVKAGVSALWNMQYGLIQLLPQ